MKPRRIKAADIPDETLLRVVDHIQRESGMWALTPDIAAVIEDCHVPWKVVNAKLAKLINRGLLDGCTCGCRGDFELTDEGRELIGAAPLPEPAPLPVTSRVEDGLTIHSVPVLIPPPWPEGTGILRRSK